MEAVAGRTFHMNPLSVFVAPRVFFAPSADFGARGLLSLCAQSGDDAEMMKDATLPLRLRFSTPPTSCEA